MTARLEHVWSTVPTTCSAVAICAERPLTRRGIGAILEAERGLTVVAEVSDCTQLRSLVDRITPGVVVLDVDGARHDITKLTSELPWETWQIGVILLVTDFTAERAADLLRTGARGVLYQDDGPTELVRSVRAVAAGGAYLSPKVTGLLADDLRHEDWSPPRRRTSDINELTERELQIFQIVAAGRTNHEVARTLFISEATVKSHFNRICKKLGITNRVQAVILAREIGMSLDDA